MEQTIKNLTLTLEKANTELDSGASESKTIMNTYRTLLPIVARSMRENPEYRLELLKHKKRLIKMDEKVQSKISKRLLSRNYRASNDLATISERINLSVNDIKSIIRGNGVHFKYIGEFGREINGISSAYSVDPSFIASIIKVESDFNPNITSGAGSKGLMGIMPNKENQEFDLFNPKENLEVGIYLIHKLLKKFDNNIKKVLIAYNCGTGNVEKYGEEIPYLETQRYVERVLNYYREFKKKTERN